MVFGNNTASDISQPRSDEWYLENFEILQASIIAEYHVQVTLLFVYNISREIFGSAPATFISLRFKTQTQVSAFLTIFLRLNIHPCHSLTLYLFTTLLLCW